MSPFTFVDIEMYSDREEDLQALYAELAAEDEGVDEELPPIIQDELPDYDFWERRPDGPSSLSTGNR